MQKKPMLPHWLLIANGAQLAADQLTYLAQGKQVMVLDGAYGYVKDCGVSIDLLLGDFDSIAPTALAQAQASATQVVHAPDQNQTDLEKGLVYLDSLGATDILIAAATGNSMQHTLYNLRLLKKFHQPQRSINLVTEMERIYYVQDTQFNITGNINDRIGILGFPAAKLTTVGLKYDMTDCLLQFEQFASVCNSLLQPMVSIKVTGSALIIQDCSHTFKGCLLRPCH